MRIFQEGFKILNAANSTSGAGVLGKGVPMKVEDFRHLMLHIATAGTATLTVKVQGSIADDAPDFTAASSVANPWSYVQIKDYLDASAIDGGTGVSAAGSDVSRLFEVNTNGLVWLNVIVTAFTGGTVTALAKVINDSNV